MNDDELKSLYGQSSTEVPDSRIDDLILAQAAEELDKTSTKTSAWRPYLATAASLTLVVALVFQLTPEQQLELQDGASPLSRMKTEPLRPTPQGEPSQLVASVASAEASMPDMDTEPMQEIIVTGSRIRPEEVEVSDYAHSKADAARKARIAESRRLRKEAAQQAATAEVSFIADPLKIPHKVLDQASILEELNQILRLYESNDTEAAKTRWKEFQKLDLDVPENEEIQALWAKLEELLQ